MLTRKKKYWSICTVLVIILGVVVYTPLITPNGIYKPTLAGIPYSLWTSFLITVALVVLTSIGTKVHPGRDEGEEES